MSSPLQLAFYLEYNATLVSDFTPSHSYRNLLVLLLYFRTMNYLRRFLLLSRPSGLLTRRVLPVTVGGLGTYVLMHSDELGDLIKQAKLLTHDFVTAPITTLMTVQAEAKYKCQDMVGCPCN